MYSPNALLGTLTPENSSKPAFSQAATPPSRYDEVGIAGAREDVGGAFARPSPSSHSTMRVEWRGTSRAKRSSRRLSGTERAHSRWFREKISSSRTSISASSWPSASMALTAGGLTGFASFDLA